VTEYTWADVGGGKTTNGTDYPKNLLTWDGSSRKCLGCHDGTVSVGQILWSNAGGPRSITMAGTDQTGGKITNAVYVIAPGGLMNGNHPVGVPYPYGGATVTTYNGITSSIDSAAKLAKWNPSPDAGGAAVKIFGAGGGGAPVAGAAGIECASCHDPHAGTGNPFYLRVSKNGSQLCLTCHKK
jgi:predicted CXXCH cytochrome family protein